MDRFEPMSVLLAVVEAGSLSAAARRLGTPLATVSRKVSELETHLKTRLFNRSSRHIKLTDAERAYVAASKRILEDVGEAERLGAAICSRPCAGPCCACHAPPQTRARKGWRPTAGHRR